MYSGCRLIYEYIVYNISKLLCLILCCASITFRNYFIKFDKNAVEIIRISINICTYKLNITIFLPNFYLCLLSENSIDESNSE